VSKDSSDAHASLSSARPGPNHGSTSVVQAPGPKPASLKANPGLLVIPPSSSSTASSVKGVPVNAQSDDRWPQSHEGDGEFYDVPLGSPPSSKYGSAHGLTGAQWHGLLPKLPNSNPTPPTGSKFGINLLHPPWACLSAVAYINNKAHPRQEDAQFVRLPLVAHRTHDPCADHFDIVEDPLVTRFVLCFCMCFLLSSCAGYERHF
jgi:hypothetical protein